MLRIVARGIIRSNKSFYTKLNQMAKTEDILPFSIRLPRSLAEQINQRANLTRRSRNSEIQAMLEYAIAKQHSSDLAIMEDMRRINAANEKLRESENSQPPVEQGDPPSPQQA